jgi:4,5-DOPA dioxygenase extradiol
MPTVFLGHGSPMNTLEHNGHTEAWRSFGQQARRPRAVLCISAHWYISDTAVTAMQQPKTLHDFGGFPQALFDVHYPAAGDPQLAARVGQLLAPTPVRQDHSEWGLDHGAWSVLKHVYPNADVPVVQLSIDATQSLAYHYQMAQRLAPLRDEGVLVMGSGNVVHNLGRIVWQPDAAPHEWAIRCNEWLRSRLIAHDHVSLTDVNALGDDGALSIPTPEHYIPLLYVLALQRPGDRIEFITDGIELGSISMLSVAIGAG